MAHLIEVVAANPGLFFALAALLLEQILPHVGNPEINSIGQLVVAFFKRKAGPTAVLLLLVILPGCVSAYAVTAASLVTAERTVQAAAEQFQPFDKAKRASIVQQATSLDTGKAALAQWDVTAERVAKAVEGAHASVKLAADGLTGVRDGLRDPSQLGAWIGPAIRVGLDLVSLLNAVGLKLQAGN